MSEKQRAVIYARYSSAGQREESIEGQIRVCQEYAGRSDIDVVGEYIDRGMTGTNTSRPQFQKMIHDSKNRRFDVVLVYKLDRFTRNRFDSAIYKNKLKENDVKVVSATESISDAPEGIILEANLEAFAEYYSKELSQKVLRGNRENLLAGKYTGGPLPLGFEAAEDKRVIINEEEAKSVRYMFERYNQGDSVKEILNSLNSRGHRTKRGAKFNYSSFENTIRNRKYIGRVEYQGEEWTSIYPQIIDDILFYSVNKKYGKKRVKQSAKATERYLLTGKLFCAECGSTFIGDSGTSRTGTPYRYYSCLARKNKKICNKPIEKKDTLEEYVTVQTLQYILSEDKKEYIANKMLEIYKKDFNNMRLEQLKSDIRKIDRKLDNCLDLMLSATNKDIIERINKQADALSVEKEDLNCELGRLEVLCKIKYTKKEILAWLNSFTGKDPSDKKLQEKVIDAFVNSVYLGEGGIVIYYNIKNGTPITVDENRKLLEECTIDTSSSSDGSLSGGGHGTRTRGAVTPYSLSRRAP
jgi:site-specific DNA recombinase